MELRINLRVKKLYEDAKIPQFAHDGDAGMDVFAYIEKSITLEPLQRALIKTGISIELEKGTEAQIRPRSGLALKHGITVLNTPGTIDEGYRGEIGIILINLGSNPFIIEKGMKIAQMVVKPLLEINIIEMSELTNSQRGTGGFGSTGTR